MTNDVACLLVSLQGARASISSYGSLRLLFVGWRSYFLMMVICSGCVIYCSTYAAITCMSPTHACKSATKIWTPRKKLRFHTSALENTSLSETNQPCHPPDTNIRRAVLSVYVWPGHTMVQLTWLVTGCSSGFGEKLVHEIIARGDRVIATARRARERLEHLKAAGAFILDLDLTWPQQGIDDAIRQAIDAYGGINVLVNNAGYLEAGLVEDVRYVGSGAERPRI